jgi:hypothetical protein
VTSEDKPRYRLKKLFLKRRGGNITASRVFKNRFRKRKYAKMSCRVTDRASNARPYIYQPLLSYEKTKREA